MNKSDEKLFDPSRQGKCLLHDPYPNYLFQSLIHILTTPARISTSLTLPPQPPPSINCLSTTLPEHLKSRQSISQPPSGHPGHRLSIPPPDHPGPQPPIPHSHPGSLGLHLPHSHLTYTLTSKSPSPSFLPLDLISCPPSPLPPPHLVFFGAAIPSNNAVKNSISPTSPSPF